MTAQIDPDESHNDRGPKNGRLKSEQRTDTANPINLWDERAMAGTAANRDRRADTKGGKTR